MHLVSNWLKRNWIAVVALISLCMSTVVAAPSVFNGSLNVVTSATITDNNAANGTVPIVNSSHVYAYVTPNPTASNACLTVTTPVNALSPVIGIANSNILATGCGGNGTGVPSLSAGTGLTSSGSWAAQTLGLAAASSYTILANNSGVTATPAPVTAAALAGMLSGSNGCPPNVQKFTSGSGTYTTPTCNGVTATVLWVRGTGGGGGGGADYNSNSAKTGPTGGGNTTFGTSLLTANGGGAGQNGPSTCTNILGGNGGAASGGNLINVGGQPGLPPTCTNANYAVSPGSTGGSNPLGAGGPGGTIGNGNGVGGIGCGAGGGSTFNVGGADQLGSGGGSGGYFESLITAPASSYSYAVGSGGSGATGGTSGAIGGGGANGCIIVVATWGTL